MTTRKWSEIKRQKGVRPAYLVTAERDGRFWFLRVIDRPELFTQVIRLDQAEPMVRDLIATWDEVPLDSFDVVIRPRVDAETDAATEALDRVRLMDALGAAIARALAVELVRVKGLSLRDAGQVLELSHQRIAQLVDEHDALGGDRRPRLEEYISQFDAVRSGKLVVIRPGDDLGKLDDLPAKVAAKLAEREGRVVVPRTAQTGRILETPRRRAAASIAEPPRT